jgi:hypothetical protein
LEEAAAGFAIQLEPTPGGRRPPGFEHVELGLSKGPRLAFAAAELLVEVDHQISRRLIVDLPECRNDALCPCFDKGIFDIRDALFADRSDARIASGQCYKIGVEVELPDLTYLKQSVVNGGSLGCKDQGRAIREFRISVSMKS